MTTRAAPSGRPSARRPVPRGVSLSEGVLAMGVLTLAVTIAAAVVRLGEENARRSVDAVAAAVLASEGLELVRAVRDGNWLAAAPWDRDLADGDYLVSDGLTTPAGERLCRLGSAGCPRARPLDFNALLRRYGYDGWGEFRGHPSRFTRLVSVRHAMDSAGNPYLRVAGHVAWRRGSSSERRVVVESHLYDWRQPE